MYGPYEISDTSLYNKRRIRGRDIWNLFPLNIKDQVKNVRLVKLRNKQVLFVFFCRDGKNTVNYEYVPFSGKIEPTVSGYLSDYRKFYCGFHSFLQYEHQSDVQKVRRFRFCFCFRRRIYSLWDIILLANRDGEKWKTKTRYGFIHCF